MDITVVVDSRLRIVLDDIATVVAEALKASVTYRNPDYAKTARMARSMPAMRWKLQSMVETIQSWSIEVDQSGREVLTLPRGANQKLKRVFKSFGLRPAYVDRRTDGMGPRPPEPYRHQLSLRDYQRESVEHVAQKQICLLRSPTGSGKTTSAIALIAKLGLPSLVIVWSTALYEQWVRRLCMELNIDKRDIGHLRGSKRTIRPITMAMQQSLYRGMTDVERQAFGLVVCDEVQRFAARTFTDVIAQFPSKYLVGISADETRKDGKEFLIYDMFGDVAHEVDQDKLIEDGSVVAVECVVVPTEFRADWYVEQRDSGMQPDFKRLLDEMTADEARNQLITSIAVREVRQRETALVFSHRVDHCVWFDSAMASNGIKCGLLIGGQEARKRSEEDLDAMMKRELLISVGTVQVIGQAIDIPHVSRGILTTPIGSNRQLFGQIRGRLSRPSPGKSVPRLYVLWDRQVVGLSTLRNMLAWNNKVSVLVNGRLIDGRHYLQGES